MSRATLLALAVLAVAASAVGPAAPAAAQSPSGSQAVVLVHHPLDHVDPFGVAFGGLDTFAARYQGFAADGTFAFPTFVADGVLGVPSLPDPNVPYQSTLANYTSLVQRRLALQAPLTLRLQAAVAGDALRIEAAADPVAPLADPQRAGALHLWAAVAEDPVHYQADARVSNGVTEHRFTVRALQDLGSVDLSSGAATVRSASIPVGPGWARDRLLAAAWVAADGPFAHFASGEVLQAAWAHAGAPAVTQSAKAVLVEVYSATWCGPCLYGDLAAESIAVQMGGAAPPASASAATRYLVGPDHPGLALGVALLAAVAVAGTTLRRRPA